jgi:hypothetical protein
LRDFALDYGVLHSARKDLHDLADRIGPKLGETVFSQVGSIEYDGGDDVFGSDDVAASFRSLYRRSQHPMSKAENNLRQLGDIFGAVADGFFDVDAQIASGMGVMGSNLGLDAWKNKKTAHDDWVTAKAAWDYRQQHAAQCVPDDNGHMPGFCYAGDPGPKLADPGPPPLDSTITTGNGSVHTVLTLDDKNNVAKEESTITHDGQTYTSVTTYNANHHDYVTDTTFAGGSKSHADVHVNDDGSGTMTVTDGNGTKTDYTKSGPGAKWEKVGGDSGSYNPADNPAPSY